LIAEKSLSGNVIEELAKINFGLTPKCFFFFWNRAIFVFERLIFMSFSISQFLIQLLLAYDNICKL